jgi:hypothetical protein
LDGYFGEAPEAVPIRTAAPHARPGRPVLSFPTMTRSIFWIYPTALIALIAACAGPQKAEENPGPKVITVKDLDSLNREVSHRDSVDANIIFYEEAYASYRGRFPGVDKSSYLRIAKGKDQEFCLFKPDPALTCVDNGDRFNDLQFKQPALDAYQAGLLSEGYNDPHVNVRLWGSMGQMAVEKKEFESAKMWFRKILDVEPGNRWALKQLSAIMKEAR